MIRLLARRRCRSLGHAWLFDALVDESAGRGTIYDVCSRCRAARTVEPEGGEPMSRCRICGDPKVVAKNRCHTCYEYLRRRGSDRTYDHVRRLTERDVERELEARRRRLYR